MFWLDKLLYSHYSFFKKFKLKHFLMYKLFLSIATIICSLHATAQFPINIQTVIAPPYTPYLSDFYNQSSKMRVILTNTTGNDQQIRFVISLVSDNGIQLVPNSLFKPSHPIVLKGFQTLTLSSQSEELRDYFTTDNLTINGIEKSSLVQSDVLPEGNYEICVRAFDYSSGIPLSSESPLGCSMIPINYTDPPMIIQPLCSENIIPLNLQNIIFTWTVPATFPSNLEYEFTLKEIPLPINTLQSKSNNLNPNDVIKNPSYSVLFTTRLKTNSFIYTPSHPKLYEGRSYVWRIKAIDNRANFTIKQNGFSEACTFTYLKESADSQMQLMSSSNQTPKDTIILISPIEREIAVSSSIQDTVPTYEFNWKDLQDTTSLYQVKIVPYSGKESIEEYLNNTPSILTIDNGLVKHSPYRLKQKLNPGTYLWRVSYHPQSSMRRLQSEVGVFKISQF